MTSVILEPTSMGKYVESDLEPQMIQQRTRNSAILYLDASDSKLELDKTNMLLSSIATTRDRARQIAQSIRRISPLSAGIKYVTPNVNITNNLIRFYSSNTGTTLFSVAVPEGFYNTPNILMTAIVTALNTASGSSGLVFSAVAVPGYTDPITGYTQKFFLDSAGGLYKFDLTCPAITNGVDLWSLPTNPDFSSTNITGNLTLYYTRYIDICSQRLNYYTKIPSNSSGLNYNIIMRVFVSNASSPHFIGFFQNPSTSCFNFNPNDTLNAIDFQLKDQFGNFLYIPEGGGPGDQSGFTWDIQLLVEF